MDTPDARPPRILIADDTPQSAELLEAYLSDGEYELRVAADGEKTLQAVAEWKPDLILLDVMMPGMDGPAALKALRGVVELAGTPVIFMTAKVQPQELAGYRRLGSLGVIAKPFDPGTLSNTVRELWEARHA